MQWTENGASGVAGRNVVRNAAEEYNDVIALVITHSSAAMVALVTRRRSKSATWSRAKVVLSTGEIHFLCNLRAVVANVLLWVIF